MMLRAAFSVGWRVKAFARSEDTENLYSVVKNEAIFHECDD